MSSKNSKIKTIKKAFRAVSAVAGFVFMGLGWLASLVPKKRGKDKAQQVRVENRKEKSVMVEVVLKIAAAVGVGAVAVYAVIQGVKKWFANRAKPSVKIPVTPSPKAERQPVPTISYQAMFAKKCELEQRMASVTGGETGMFMLREIIRDAADKGMPDIQYREAYRMKQDKLRGYMKDYRELLKQAESAPEEESGRFQPEEDLERYQELLDEKV